MRLLLDTHVFIWLYNEPDQLSRRVLELIQDEDHTFYLSAVSVWEIQIKHQIGKLTLTLPLSEIVQTYHTNYGLHILPIELAHIYRLNELPLHHRDPFDRLLIAQAQAEDLTIITRDAHFQDYAVPRFW